VSQIIDFLFPSQIKVLLFVSQIIVLFFVSQVDILVCVFQTNVRPLASRVDVFFFFLCLKLSLCVKS